MKKSIFSTEAPKPIGPYNQAVKTGGLVFVSGQLPMDAESGELVTSNIKDETRTCMENIGHILYATDMDFKNIVKVSIFVKDMGQFSQINEVYGEFFEGMTPPARETVQVADLPLSVNVEISVIASE